METNLKKIFQNSISILKYFNILSLKKYSFVQNYVWVLLLGICHVEFCSKLHLNIVGLHFIK